VIEAKINVVSFEFKPVVLDGELVPATDYPGYDSWKDAITEDGIDFSKITKDQAIAMGLPDVDYYGIAMKLVVGEETIDLNTTNLTKVERVTPSGDVQSALVTETGTVQFVHDGWGEAGKYTMYYYLTDGRIVEVTVNVVSFEFKGEAPVDTEAPKIDTTSLVLEEGKLILTVEASDNIGLESLEVDHNLGKHSSTPEEFQLPEFRVPTESIDEVTFEIGQETINAGSVDYENGKWTITFNDGIVAVMKDLALEYQDGTIKFYLVVRDLAGNESGSMYDTTYEVVEYTWE